MTYLGVLVERTVRAGLELDQVEAVVVEEAVGIIEVACRGAA